MCISYTFLSIDYDGKLQVKYSKLIYSILYLFKINENNKSYKKVVVIETYKEIMLLIEGLS